MPTSFRYNNNNKNNNSHYQTYSNYSYRHYTKINYGNTRGSGGRKKDNSDKAKVSDIEHSVYRVIFRTNNFIEPDNIH